MSGDRISQRSQLSTLGGLLYTTASERIRFPGSAGTVVAFLAVQEGAVKRTVVAGTLWPDVPEERACGNLRSALWRLRKLAPDLIQTTDGFVMIDEMVETDFVETRAWATRLVRGQPTEVDLARQVSPNALELLPGRYEDWAVFERERFRQRLLHATEALATQLARRGRFAEAIEAALTAICADPLRESAHRVAVECHLAEHNVAEAKRQLGAYVALLDASLGIAPSDEFMQLVEAVSVKGIERATG